MTEPSVTRRTIPTLGLQDLHPGDEWESPARTVTESDVVGFAGVSGDYNPIHVDHESAASGPFGRPIAHGLLGLAMASGLGSFAPRLETLAFLEISEWKFLEPITFGDTIRLVSRVLTIESRARGRRGVVTWSKRLVNQRGVTVQEGITRTLVAARKETAGSEPAT